jgi:hypothetical protein
MDSWNYQKKKGKSSKKDKEQKSESINFNNPFDILKKSSMSEFDEKIFEGKRIFESYPSVKTSI